MTPTVESLLKTSASTLIRDLAARDAHHQAAADERARRAAQPPPEHAEPGGPRR